MLSLDDEIRDKLNTEFRVLLIMASLVAAILFSMYGMARAAGVPFTLWFDDMTGTLLAYLILLLVSGLLWDSALILAPVFFRPVLSRFFPATPSSTQLPSFGWRKAGFFPLGIWPCAMLMLTLYAVLATSNLARLYFKLIGSITVWHDPLLWSLEAPIISRLTGESVNVLFWGVIYESLWAWMSIVFFAVVVFGRQHGLILRFCVSLVMLFYLGRLLGILIPVMGPAYYYPDFFGYLNGTPASTGIRAVLDVYAMAGSDVNNDSAWLLGSSAPTLPSLHVGIAALTSFWLAAVFRWTLFISVPWFALNCVSTILLGQHYILDGLCGIVLAAGCVWGVNWGFSRLSKWNLTSRFFAGLEVNRH